MIGLTPGMPTRCTCHRPALFGLVLAGGASTRMQRDKAALQYHGQPQLRWAFELLSQVCAATFVSVRPDQRDEPTRAAFPQIVDRQPGIGPIAGISAALLEHPKAAWLVLACDLPFLTAANAAAPDRAPRSAHASRPPIAARTTDLPEPLCAIWEPAAREPVLAYIASGKQCPRKFLINSDTALLDLPERQALDNVNTAEEFGAATARAAARLRLRQPAERAGARAEHDRSHPVLRDPARAGRAQRGNARYERRARRPSSTRSCGSVIRSS